MIRTIMAFVMLMSVGSVHAVEVGGVNVAESYKEGDQSLTLNGAGVRTRFWIDIYVAALYVANKAPSAQEIINADEPMSIRIFVTSGLVNGEKMAEATRDGFLKATGGELGEIEPQVNALINTFKDAVEEDDVFDLSYIPGTGVLVKRNGELKTTAKGLAFKQALFGIWLSDDPVQSSLKKGLLGK